MSGFDNYDFTVFDQNCIDFKIATLDFVMKNFKYK